MSDCEERVAKMSRALKLLVSVARAIQATRVMSREGVDEKRGIYPVLVLGWRSVVDEVHIIARQRSAGNRWRSGA